MNRAPLKYIDFTPPPVPRVWQPRTRIAKAILFIWRWL